MAALPYMQLEIGRYLADTTHLSTVEHGAYMLLIMNYWQRGRALNASDDRLATICRMTPDEWGKHRETLMEFFEVVNGEWVHNRVEKDLDSAKKRVAGAKAAGAASVRKRNGKATDVENPLNGNPTDTPTDDQRIPQRIGNQDKTREEKTREEKLPVLVAPMGEIVFDHSMVTQGVLMELRLSGANLSRNVSDVAKAEIAAGADGMQLMERMTDAGRQYLEAKSAGKLSFPVGLEKFYGEGLWRDPKLWPWKDGMRPAARAAPDPLEEIRREREQALKDKERQDGDGS